MLMDDPTTTLDDTPFTASQVQLNNQEEQMENNSTNYGLWVATGALLLSILGSVVSYNSDQTTISNGVEVNASDIKETRKELELYIEKEVYILNDRITRLESDIANSRADIEARLREKDDQLHSTNIRAEKNETLLELVVDGKIP